MYSGVPNTAPCTVSASQLVLDQHLGDAEIEHLDEVVRFFALGDPRVWSGVHANQVTATGPLDQHDVVGLEIAVDDADGVRGIERERDLVRDVERAMELDGAFLLDQILERLALEVLHHEVDRALGQDAEVGDVDDVRVVDRGRRARLAEEAMDRLLVARELRMQHLHRDRLLDVDVLAL